MDKDTGLIVTNGEFDFETAKSYTLVVRAYDNGDADGFSSLRSNAAVNVEVTITDINDNKPVITNEPYIVSLAENLGAGVAITTITSSDTDTGGGGVDGHEFSLTGGNGKFTIDTDTGKVSTTGSLDFEAQTSYTVGIEVTDGLFRDTTTVAITVTDANDCPPVFKFNAINAGEIGELSSKGTIIATFETTDCDTEPFAGVTFAITNGNVGAAFKIDGSKLVLNDPAAIDYEAAPHAFDIVVTAEDTGDGDHNTADAHVFVTITDENDHFPVFREDAYTIEVPETAKAGSTITTVYATDKDQGDNGAVTYFLVASAVADLFDIDKNSGEVTLKSEGLDATVKYDFKVQATDGGEVPRLSAQISITVTTFDVNAASPSFDKPDGYAVEIAEDTTFPTPLITVKAAEEDGDEGAHAKITYSIIGGNVDGLFAIGTTSGIISLVGGVDFESQTTHTIILEAKDGGDPPLRGRSKLTVSVTNVNDLAPKFSISSFLATVLECNNQEPLSLTCQKADGKLALFPGELAAAASDGDGDKLTYTLTAVSPAPDCSRIGGLASTCDSQFLIDRLTGALTVREVGPELDFETVSEYVLTVAVDDGTNPRDTATITVTVNDVNDAFPSFSTADLGEIQLEEGVPQGSLVAKVSASDVESGLNGKLVYKELVILPISGDPPLPDESAELKGSSAPFTLDEETGAIQTTKDFDFDDGGPQSFHLSYFAHDSGVLLGPLRSGVQSLQVSIKDIDDNAPQILSSPTSIAISYAEDTGAGVFCTRVEITDSDVTEGFRDNVVVIDPRSSGAAHFKVAKEDDTHWTVTTTGTGFDFESITEYKIRLFAHTRGKPLQRSNDDVTVTVTITDVNDNDPQFEPFGIDEVTVTLPEDTQPGEVLARFAASDADAAGTDASAVVFSKVNGGDKRISVSADGKVVIAGAIGEPAPFDFEVVDDRITTIKIACKDKGGRAAPTTVDLILIITDVNDNPPEFTIARMDSTIAPLEEELPTGVRLTQAFATDADSTNPGAIPYFRLKSGGEDFKIEHIAFGR